MNIKVCKPCVKANNWSPRNICIFVQDDGDTYRVVCLYTNTIWFKASPKTVPPTGCLRIFEHRVMEYTNA